MVTMQVRFTDDTLKKLQASFERAPLLTAEAVKTAMNRSLYGYRDTARNLAPVASGDLKNNIDLTPATQEGTTISGSVQTNSPHARFQEEGTGIYGPYKRYIRPKNASMLAWKKDGVWYRAKKVAGTKPRRFMLGSFNQKQQDTMRIFSAAIDRLAQQLGGAR
jgi:HK97 gp10 family phage protein